MPSRHPLYFFIAAAISIVLLLNWHSLIGINPWQQEDNSLRGNVGRGAQMQSFLAAPSSSSSPILPFADFPKLIWQTGSTDGIAQYHDQSTTWTSLNPNYQHNILTDSDADDFVHSHFAHRQSLIHFWDALETPVLRADLLRYLLILSEGGVYGDIDTSCLEPIETWIPPAYRMRANAVMGIEYDDNTYKMFVRPISFNQWTLMAKPNHPIFVRAVERVISNLEFLARQKRTNLGKLKLEMVETLEATGPGMISDVVMEVLRDQVGKETKIDWATFHGLREPMLVGDVLILPINAFAGHQKHSHSGNKEYGRKLVRHHFGRTWYKNKTGNKDKGDAEKGHETVVREEMVIGGEKEHIIQVEKEKVIGDEKEAVIGGGEGSADVVEKEDLVRSRSPSAIGGEVESTIPDGEGDTPEDAEGNTMGDVKEGASD